GFTVIGSQCPLVHVQMLAEWAFDRGLDLPDLDVRRPSLEDVYLSLTHPSLTTPTAEDRWCASSARTPTPPTSSPPRRDQTAAMPPRRPLLDSVASSR